MANICSINVCQLINVDVIQFIKVHIITIFYLTQNVPTFSIRIIALNKISFYWKYIIFKYRIIMYF